MLGKPLRATKSPNGGLSLHSLHNIAEGIRKKVTNLEQIRGHSVLTKVIAASLNGVIPKPARGAAVDTPPDTPRSSQDQPTTTPPAPLPPAIPSQGAGPSGTSEAALPQEELRAVAA